MGRFVQIGHEDWINREAVTAVERRNGTITMSTTFGTKWLAPEWTSSIERFIRALEGSILTNSSDWGRPAPDPTTDAHSAFDSEELL